MREKILRWSRALPAAAGLAAATAACPAAENGSDSIRAGAPAGSVTVAGETPTVLFLGTSLTAGYGLAPDEAYPALIRAKLDSAGLDYRVVNAGVSGATSAEGLSRIDWLLRQRVDVLVLELGANDGLRGRGVDQMRENLQAIIDRTKAAYPDAAVVIAGMEAPPNLGRRYTDEFRRVFREIAEANDAALIPFLLEGVAADASLNQVDGIHPTAAGQRIVADNVWVVLERVLTTRGR